MCSVSQCKARNGDENKRKVAAMFEHSGSEEESEKEIKTTVDRIVEESGKADQQTVKARWFRFQRFQIIAL